MDPVSAIGSAAAVLGLAGTAGKTAMELADCIQTMKHAHEDLDNVQMELSNYASLLRMFERTISDSASLGAQMVEAHRLDKGLCKQSKYTLNRMRRVLESVGYLAKDVTVQTTWKRNIVRLRWYMKKDEMVPLQRQLDSVKTSISLFVTLIQFNEKLEEVKRMEVVPKPWRRYMIDLQRQLEAAQASCEIAQLRNERTRPAARQPAKEQARIVQTVIGLADEQLLEFRHERRLRHTTPRRPPPSPSPSPSQLSDTTPVEPRPPQPPAGPSGAETFGDPQPVVAERSIVEEPQPQPVTPIPPSRQTGSRRAHSRRHRGPSPDIAVGTAPLTPPQGPSNLSGEVQLPTPEASAPTAPIPPAAREFPVDQEDESILPDRRMWMRTEGPPIWEERPRGGRGTGIQDDIAPYHVDATRQSPHRRRTLGSEMVIHDDGTEIQEYSRSRWSDAENESGEIKE